MKQNTVYMLLSILLYACASNHSDNPQNYHSESLEIEKVSAHVYQHISYLNTESFGRVSCNGMLVFDGQEAIIFDTPADTATSTELIRWVEDELGCTIKAIIPTHFHADCLGGLEVFHQHGIASYAHRPTIALASEQQSAVPQQAFDSLLQLQVGEQQILTAFLGEGHTRDNVVGYVPEDKVMFGGCLIKEVGASEGFLGDANTAAWPATVTALKNQYAGAEVIIPGHGKTGGTELLDYTIQLFASRP